MPLKMSHFIFPKKALFSSKTLSGVYSRVNSYHLLYFLHLYAGCPALTFTLSTASRTHLMLSLMFLYVDCSKAFHNRLNIFMLCIVALNALAVHDCRLSFIIGLHRVNSELVR